MIARGSARCGSLTSSPAVETASRPMKEKKIVPAAALMPRRPRRPEVVEAVGLERRQPDHDEHHQDAQLDEHHDRVDLGGLAGPPDQQHRAHGDQHDRGQVDQAVGAVVRDGRVGQRVGNGRADRLVEELVEVAAPSDGDRGRGHAVLQQDARGDDHRHELAERVVGVGVRRPAHRDRAGHLGVAQRREPGGQARDQERDDDGRPGVRHGLLQHEEDAGADGGADAEHGQLERAEAAAQIRPAVRAFLRGHRLLASELFAERDGHGAPSRG